jgi:serine/threonine protein kinase
MLFPGTRIGPARILRHLGENLFGDSYEVVGEAGKGKGDHFLVKVLPRELLEDPGFSDHFLRECQVIEQLDQDGISALESYGVTKWKHWLRYAWEPGLELAAATENTEETDGPPKFRRASSLWEYMDARTEPLLEEEVLVVLTSILLALRSAHAVGLMHGNLKPSNVLLGMTDSGSIDARLTEFSLSRLTGEEWFRARWKAAEDANPSEELSEAMIASRATFLHRSPEELAGGVGEEQGDLFSIGLVARRMLTGCSPEKVRSPELDENLPLAWAEWMAKATAKKPEDRFPDVGRAIVALPGIGDITRFGLSSDEEPDEQSLIDAEQLRLQREIEWEAVEKARSLKAKRGITGLLAGVFLACYLVSSIHALLYPKPWVEYKHATALDSFQLGVGLWSGKAWGVTPKIYDPFKKGGQDVPGEWTLDDGHFQLRFRKFKLVGPNGNGKKRWQSMGTDSTSSDAYFVWTDVLSYDRDSDALMFVKRIGDKGETYIPVADKNGDIRFVLESRLGNPANGFKKAELRFDPEKSGESHWTLFFGLGFLAASLLYRFEQIPLLSRSKKSDSTQA